MIASADTRTANDRRVVLRFAVRREVAELWETVKRSREGCRPEIREMFMAMVQRAVEPAGTPFTSTVQRWLHEGVTGHDEQPGNALVEVKFSVAPACSKQVTAVARRLGLTRGVLLRTAFEGWLMDWCWGKAPFVPTTLPPLAERQKPKARNEVFRLRPELVQRLQEASGRRGVAGLIRALVEEGMSQDGMACVAARGPSRTAGTGYRNVAYSANVEHFERVERACRELAMPRATFFRVSVELGLIQRGFSG